MSFFLFVLLEAFMPHHAYNTLRVLCERIVSLNRLDDCFPYGHSKYARFYRWATKMKAKWNIEEEKLIITFIIEIITITFTTMSLFV